MKVIIAGDFVPKARIAKHAKDRNFQKIFQCELVNIIKSTDYSLVNFESPIIEQDFKPIKKSGPNLSCTIDAADAVRYAGFTAVTMANNHILDYGINGLNKTIDYCRTIGLEFVGVGNNLQDAEKVLYVEKKGKKLAIINCCEHEFSIATGTSAGANPLNPIRQYYCIQEANRKADYVLVIVHGGHEGFQLPSPRMKETYRFFIDAGADAVVNHHQHCYSGYEIYNGKPIFYGLGNFSFDRDNKRDNIWNEGYILLLSLDNESVNYQIIPYIQGNDYEGVKIMNEVEHSKFLKSIECLNKIIANDALLDTEHKKFIKKTAKNYLLSLEPYQNKFLRALFIKGLLPSFFPKDKMIKLLNFIQCESHLDRMRYVLKITSKLI